MAGQGVIHVQRTFWRMPARAAAAGTRRPAVRLCRVKPKLRKPEAGGQKRVRIRRDLAPHVAKWLRMGRTQQALLTHALNMMADPEKAGGSSLAGDCYVEAAMAGDPRIILDVMVSLVFGCGAIADEIRAFIDPKPTAAMPGTPEKVEEMRRRQERFQALHSDKDKRR